MKKQYTLTLADLQKRKDRAKPHPSKDVKRFLQKNSRVVKDFPK